MSAIYGCVSKKEIESTLEEDLKFFNVYKFDRSDTKSIKNVTFSCFMQEFTIESTHEILPYYDSENDCLITADVIIDNREELSSQMNVKLHQGVSDSELIMKAYLKWGLDFPKYIIGVFAIAIYDFKCDKLILVRDQLGQRSLYYSVCNDVVKFSTIEKPLTNGMLINEDFIRRFISIRYVLDDFIGKETAYKNIFYVEPAGILIFEGSKITSFKYWELKKQKITKSINDEIIELKNIFTEAIACRIRTKGNVGIKLSGGLDSSAIAYIVAPMLKEKSKKLFAYTTISDPKYLLKYHKSVITDESNIVKMIRDRYDNIELDFIVSSGDTPFNVIEQALEIFEQPYKFVTNSYWVLDISNHAMNDGCKILLNGQFGNFTLSHDNIVKHLNNLLLKFKWITFYKDIKRYCRKKKMGRKQLLRHMFSYTFIKDKRLDYLNQYGILSTTEKKTLGEYFKDTFATSLKSIASNSTLKSMTSSAVLNHLGAVETKLSLKYNLIERDPFRDVRVIEKCYSLPVSVYNTCGDERALIKELMKDTLPEEILDPSKRGLQAADWPNRIKADWKEIRTSIINTLDEIPDGVINKDIFVELLNQYDNDDFVYNIDAHIDVRNFLVVHVVAKWFSENQKQNGIEQAIN